MIVLQGESFKPLQQQKTHQTLTISIMPAASYETYNFYRMREFLN